MQGRKKILIVDDEEVNRRLLGAYFENDFAIYEASDGREAIRVIEQQGDLIAMILLDLIMPNLDGFGVLQYLNDYGYIGDVPVILITVDDATEREEQAFDLGVSDFITKPFHPRIVQKRVHNVIDLFEGNRRLRYIIEEQNAMIYDNCVHMK